MVSQWITLVVHPGPPGDAGPSSLDWALLGDDGSDHDSDATLTRLLGQSMDDWPIKQRSHWGTIVFQANEQLDGGSVWAWEQYELPEIGTTTKAQLYQNQHSTAAIVALITAMIRVYITASPLGPTAWLELQPKEAWATLSVTLGARFLGGPTHERPLLQSKQRKPDFRIHHALDILRIVNAGDSQPGAQLGSLTEESKTSLFMYGAHIHRERDGVPPHLYEALGYDCYEDIPNGEIIATRLGSVFFKTKLSPHAGAGVWITHGRVPKKVGSPLQPKVPIVEAIQDSGHGSALIRVLEWSQETFEETPGEWQQVYVRGVDDAQLVYWDF